MASPIFDSNIFDPNIFDAQSGNIASGTPTLSKLISSSDAFTPTNASGAPLLSQLISVADAYSEPDLDGSGTPTLPQLTTIGSAVHAQSASGTPTLPQLTSTGVAFHGGQNAEGLITLPQLTSSGVAEFAAVGGDAQIFLPALEALGSSGQLFTASGAVTLALLRATGKASPYIPVYRAVGIVFPKSNPYGIFVHEPWWPYKRIADLTVWASNIDRTYERMQAGVASLNLPAQLSDNHSIHQGNILVIISRDQPTWAGTILIHDDALGTGQITIFARELSNILDKRTAPQAERYNFGIGSTYYFRSLINKMNARGFTGIELAAGLEPGPTLYDIFAGGQTVFQDLEEIHNRTNWEWWMEYEAAPGYLRSRIKWGYKQGVDLSATHHLWHPINFKSISLRHDVSEGKQVTTSIGGFGRPVWERTAVTREANYGPQRLDIGGTIELAPELVVRTVAELPAGLRDERVQLEVTTESPNELSRRAQREQERRLAGETQIRMTVVGLSDRTMLQVGNYITIHAPVGHHGELDGAVRIVGVQPDEELGETDVIAEVRV